VRFYLLSRIFRINLGDFQDKFSILTNYGFSGMNHKLNEFGSVMGKLAVSALKINKALVREPEYGQSREAL
jgi:hypothetical protein